MFVASANIMSIVKKQPITGCYS